MQFSDKFKMYACNDLYQLKHVLQGVHFSQNEKLFAKSSLPIDKSPILGTREDYISGS